MRQRVLCSLKASSRTNVQHVRSASHTSL
uniref:Uncharacterized protein n=1 Tax=Anguilla anguilla TaxID=7936 RepID=A0A0E9RKU3_ANGAN